MNKKFNKKIFCQLLSEERKKYLAKLEFDKEEAEKYPPITYDEKFEFFFRKHFIIPVFAVGKTMIKTFKEGK